MSSTLTKNDKRMDKLEKDMKSLKESNLLVVDTLENVIKLSGADEAKKNIYIRTTEEAKDKLKKDGETNEV